jgi:hypothetical protein
MDEISNVFHTRDEAVRTKNNALFLSTQIEKIKEASSLGYIAQDKLETVVLATVNTGEFTKVAFVKETYFPEGKQSHDSFLMYFLVITPKGWKIFRVVC